MARMGAQQESRAFGMWEKLEVLVALAGSLQLHIRPRASRFSYDTLRNC